MCTDTVWDIPFLVVLSKMDTVVPGFRDSPSKKFPDIERLIIQASQMFSINQNQVYPLINYYRENGKVFDIDKYTYKILHSAYSVAKNRRLPESTKKVIFDDY